MIPARFSLEQQHYRPNFHCPLYFRETWEYAKDVYKRLVNLEKA